MSMISKKDRLEITNSWLLNSKEYSEYKKCYEDLKLYIENAVESHLTKEQRSAWDNVRSDMDLEDSAKTQEFYIDLDFLLGISKKSRGDLTTILENGRWNKALDTQVEVFSGGVDFNNGCVKIEEDLPFMFRPYAVDAEKIKASYPEFYEGLCERAGNYVELLKKINRKLEKIFDLLTCNTTLELISKNLRPSSSVSEIDLLSKDEKDAGLLGTLITGADRNLLMNFYCAIDHSRYTEFLDSVSESHLSKIGSEIKKLWNEYVVSTCPVLGELLKVSPSLCSTSPIFTYCPTLILGEKFRDFLDRQLGRPVSRANVIAYGTIRIKYSDGDGLVVKKASRWSMSTRSGFEDWVIRNKTNNDLNELRKLTVDFYKAYQDLLNNKVLYLDYRKDYIILRDRKGVVRKVKTYKDLLDIDESAFDEVCKENGWTVNKKVSIISNIPPCDSKREELITLCTERIKDWVN